MAKISNGNTCASIAVIPARASHRRLVNAKLLRIGICAPQAAIVAEGLRRGTRRHRSVALGVAAQFELTLRQVDVIGTWEKLDQAEAVQASAVVERGRIWRPGLRFEDFAAGRLDVETSKTSTQAVYDVTAYPLFQQALAAVPASERVGPLVTDELYVFVEGSDGLCPLLVLL